MTNPRIGEHDITTTKCKMEGCSKADSCYRKLKYPCTSQHSSDFKGLCNARFNYQYYIDVKECK